MRFKLVQLFIVLIFVSSLHGFTSSSQQNSCTISLSLQPPSLYYSSLPSSGNGFAELVSSSYSPDLANTTFEVQFYNGESWVSLSSFVGNNVQNNLVYIGVYPNWAHYGDNFLRVESNHCISNVAKLTMIQNNRGIAQDSSIWIIIALSLHCSFS